MEYRKNDIVTLEIVDCGTDGEGIGKADGFTVFVKDAVIGDIVTAKIMKAKKNYGYGRLMEILKPSPYRVEPVCPSARQCGGCQLQAVSYEEQKVFKEKKLRGHLERIGGFRSSRLDGTKKAGSSPDFMQDAPMRSSRTVTVRWESRRTRKSWIL